MLSCKWVQYWHWKLIKHGSLFLLQSRTCCHFVKCNSEVVEDLWQCRILSFSSFREQTEQLKPGTLKALTEYQTDIQAAASTECSSSKKNLVPPAACSFEACCGLMGLRFKRTLSHGDGGESEERSDGSQTKSEKRKRVSAGQHRPST